MRKGIFCISLDTEFLWGRHDKNWEEFVWRAKKTRKIIKKLLELFKKYDIPVTWAIVGKLYEKPKKNQKYGKLWHASDVIQLIKDASSQEIGCHSYSHPEFTEISKKQAEEDLQSCPKSMSFVFPRNKIKHLEVLRKNGFLCYRGDEFVESKLIELARLVFGVPRVATILKNQRLTNIPSTMYFVSRRGYRKYLPMFLRVRLAKNGIKKAIRQEKLFHLWFHPIDFSDDTKKMFGGLESVLKFASKKRDGKLLKIKTMGQLELK